MTAGMKTLAYTDSVLALAEARAGGADEAVFVRDGVVLEGAHTNVFAVLDGRTMLVDYHGNTNYSVVDGELIEEIEVRMAEIRTREDS